MSMLDDENNESYLSFRIGNELFAAHVSKVISIIEETKLTKMPNTPPYVLGVINLRGVVLPIIDTHIKLRIPKDEEQADPIIVVMEVIQNGRAIMIGAMVDGVREVMEVSKSQILRTPEIGGKYKSEFISGMVQEKDKFIMILDIDEIFTNEKILSIFGSEEEEDEEIPDDVDKDKDVGNEENQSSVDDKDVAEKWLQKAIEEDVTEEENDTIDEHSSDQHKITEKEDDSIESVSETESDSKTEEIKRQIDEFRQKSEEENIITEEAGETGSGIEKQADENTIQEKGVEQEKNNEIINKGKDTEQESKNENTNQETDTDETNDNSTSESAADKLIKSIRSKKNKQND